MIGVELTLPTGCPIDMAPQTVTLVDLTTDFEHCAEIFEQYGCFVVDDAIETPEMLDELEAAARRVVALVQSGEHDFSLDPDKATGNSPAATQINAGFVLWIARRIKRGTGDAHFFARG